MNKIELTDDMTLEEKLAKIEEAMQEAQVEHKKRVDMGIIPNDPAENPDLVCLSCQ